MSHLLLKEITRRADAFVELNYPKPSFGMTESITYWWRKYYVPTWFNEADVFLLRCTEEGLTTTAAEIKRIIEEEARSIGFDHDEGVFK